MKHVASAWRFFAGMSSAVNPADLPPEYAVEASNGNFERRGEWTVRKGLVRSNYDYGVGTLNVPAPALLTFYFPGGPNVTIVQRNGFGLEVQSALAPALTEADF